MSSTTGKAVRVTIFGQSHGEAIGVVMDGLPAGETVDLDALQVFLNRRAPGRSRLATQRAEADKPRFLSGLVDGKTCGAPLCAIIENTDARSGDYAAFADLPRPGHADYPAHVRYGGHADMRGGGHFSGRLTAPLCIAGGIAMQMLARRGIAVGAHLSAVGGVEDTLYDPVNVDEKTLHAPGEKSFPVLGEKAGVQMQSTIEAALREGDSIGGSVECCAIGLPPGLGDPIFGGVENRLSAVLFGIPAVRGVSFGAGFSATEMTGSQHNDAYILREGRIAAGTNRHGGLLGGITTGMPLLVNVAFKPTPTIARPQRTVRLSTLVEEELRAAGRHDPCVAPRAVPCVEAAVALVLLDMLCERGW